MEIKSLNNISFKPNDIKSVIWYIGFYIARQFYKDVEEI